MITKNPLLILATGLLLFGCGSALTPEPTLGAAANVARTVNEVAISSGTPVTMADISIDGMSCEMMCGGAIKKSLGALPGIASTEIRFVEGDEQDHAIVAYDESKVTDAEMIEAIQALHDGQYKVISVAITKQVKGVSAGSSDASKKKEETSVKTSYTPSSSVIIPSVLAILSRILAR